MMWDENALFFRPRPTTVAPTTPTPEPTEPPTPPPTEPTIPPVIVSYPLYVVHSQPLIDSFIYLVFPKSLCNLVSSHFYLIFSIKQTILVIRWLEIYINPKWDEVILQVCGYGSCSVELMVCLAGYGACKYMFRLALFQCIALSGTRILLAGSLVGNGRYACWI